MRLKHISDTELQEYLDRKMRRVEDSAADLLATEHLSNCPYCRETLREYEELYASIELCPQPALAEGFTSRVMARLPEYTPRQSKYALPAGILGPIAAIITLLLTIDLKPALGNISAVSMKYFTTLLSWWSSLSFQSLPRPDLSIDLSFFQKLQSAFTEPSGTSLMIACIGVTLLIIVASEARIPERARQR